VADGLADGVGWGDGESCATTSGTEMARKKARIIPAISVLSVFFMAILKDKSMLLSPQELIGGAERRQSILGF
jgi:hypothetical protein